VCYIVFLSYTVKLVRLVSIVGLVSFVRYSSFLSYFKNFVRHLVLNEYFLARGNQLPGTAFVMYGSFWLGLGFFFWNSEITVVTFGGKAFKLIHL